MKRFISVLLSLVMMLGLLAYLPIQVKAYEEVKSTVYTDCDLVGGKGSKQFNARKYLKENGTFNYRAWSQDQLPWGLYKLGGNSEYATFHNYGCLVTAFAKIAVQSGNYSVHNMDPGIMNELMQRNGCFQTGNGNCNSYDNTAKLIGLTYVKKVSYNNIVSELKTDNNKQFIIYVTNSAGGPHYVPVNNELTIKYGKVYIDDSWGTSDGNKAKSTVFSTAQSKYRTGASTLKDYERIGVGKTPEQQGFTVNSVYMFTTGTTTDTGNSKVTIESYSNKTAGTTGDNWLYPAFKVTVPNYKNSKISTVGYSVYTVNDTEMFRFEETYRSGVNQDGTSYKNTFFGARTDGGANMDLEKDIYNIKKEYLTDLRFLPGHNYIVRGFVVFDGKRYESDGHRMKTTGIGDQHMYDDGYVAAEPTCIYKGVMKYICRMCGCSKTESIPPKGHTPGAAATCTTPQKCTVCGTQLASPTDHKFDNGIISKEPTCLDDGVKTYTCSLCGETKTEPIISGKRHTPGAAATCTTPQKCTVCGTQLAAALGHNYTGSYYYSSHPHEEYQKCTRCNAEKKTGSTKKIDGCSICYPTFTITYNANGGTGEPASQTKTNGKALTLSSTKPTRQGYTFLGWATSSGASSAQYNPGSSFTTDANTTLYAVWRKNAVPTGAQIVVGNVTGKPGNTVGVPISLKNNPGITSMKLSIEYDSNVMTLTRVEDFGKLGPTAMHNKNLLIWDNDIVKTNFTVNGEIVRLYFTINPKAVENTYTVTVKYDNSNFDIFNAATKTVHFDVIEGAVRVTNVMCGDINSDGKVNSLDRAILSRHIAKWKGYEIIDEAAADVDGDGRITVHDRAVLARHVAKWDGYLKLPYIGN